MIAKLIEIEGTLQADGRLILDEKPALPAGRVRVALQALVPGKSQAERLPDAPWPDDSIPAPFDLPREGAVVPVQTRTFAERLPELPPGLTEMAG
jgi:hypothetical protein